MRLLLSGIYSLFSLWCFYFIETLLANVFFYLLSKDHAQGKLDQLNGRVASNREHVHAASTVRQAKHDSGSKVMLRVCLCVICKHACLLYVFVKTRSCGCHCAAKTRQRVEGKMRVCVCVHVALCVCYLCVRVCCVCCVYL